MTTLLIRCLAFLLLMLPFVPAVADDPDDKEIARLVKQLGSSDCRTREAARKELEAIGEPAFSPLEMEAEAKAVRALRKLGGTCTTLSDVVGKPVVGVQFVAAPIRMGGFGYREMATEGMKEFKAFTRLKSLKLDRTDVTDESMKELKDLKTLQSLDVSHTRVTDVGLKQFKELQGLQALVLAGTTVTDAGLKELAGLKSLQELDLRDTNVTDEGVAELRKALPKVSVSRR